jgi:hypothetical protein
VGLVDRRVRIGRGTRIRVGYGDAAKFRSADDLRLFLERQQRLEQRIELGGIAVRPAVHGNGFDIPGRIKASRIQRAGQLIADIPLERGERRRQQLRATDLVLLVLGETRPGRNAHHANENRIIRR